MKVFTAEYEAAIKYIEENNPAAHPITGFFSAKEVLDGLIQHVKENPNSRISTGGFHVFAEEWDSDQPDTIQIELTPAFDHDYDNYFEA